MEFKNIDQTQPYTIKNAFDLNEINSLLSSLNVSNAQHDSGNVHQSQDEGFYRKSIILNESNFSKVLEDKVYFIAKEANKQYNFDLKGIISLYYMEYLPSNIGLKWHTDIGFKSPFNQRKLSFSIALNNNKEYKGGEVDFFYDEKDVLRRELELGDALFFPSFIPHKVNIVTEGIRKTLVGFLGGEPYR